MFLEGRLHNWRIQDKGGRIDETRQGQAKIRFSSSSNH